MVKLKPVGFPSKYLDCYESAMMCIFKYMGLSDEILLMGTQAYFVVDEEKPGVYPRFHFINEEWERIHGLAVERLSASDETDLRDKIIDKLRTGMPVCLTTDIYFLPHTSHYRRLHQIHFIDVFGYDHGRYYIVCPYYRFAGWMDASTVYEGFFAPALGGRYLAFVPEPKCETLPAERVCNLVRESCEYMLGLKVPKAYAGTSPQLLGLAGIRTFSALLQRLAVDQEKGLRNKTLMLSAQTMAIGYSRYWFHKLIETCQPRLLPVDVADELEGQFVAVIRSWKAVGARFGAAIHAGDSAMMKRIAKRLEEIYRLEYQLFSCLLGALPDYESGTL